MLFLRDHAKTKYLLYQDSVSFQMFDAMEQLLDIHVGKYPREFKYIQHLEDNGIFITHSEYSLDQENPYYNELLNRPSLASVPRWRFSRPIMTTFRSDTLITQEELDQNFLQVGMASRSFRKFFRKTVNHQKNLVDPVNRHNHRAKGDWRQGLRNISSRRDSGWKGELDTLVVLNTGPHWSPVHMEPATHDELIGSYTLMVKSYRSRRPPLTFDRRRFNKSASSLLHLYHSIQQKPGFFPIRFPSTFSFAQHLPLTRTATSTPNPFPLIPLLH
jgi:hypothetical protein